MADEGRHAPLRKTSHEKSPNPPRVYSIDEAHTKSRTLPLAFSLAWPTGGGLVTSCSGPAKGRPGKTSKQANREGGGGQLSELSRSWQYQDFHDEKLRGQREVTTRGHALLIVAHLPKNPRPFPRVRDLLLPYVTHPYW